MAWKEEKDGDGNTFWVYRDQWQANPAVKAVHVAFYGVGIQAGEAALASLVPAEVTPAWLKQIHSARVRTSADGGYCGEGDALISDRSEVAPLVVTADCVPVLVASEHQVAAVHAGWRGVAAEIVVATLDRLSGAAVAWIGPCISGEVYEVSPEVAQQVVDVSAPSVRHMGTRGRPHVDLRAAVELQLRRHGVAEVRHAAGCTFSEPDRFWSYRRQGKEAGRNVSLIRRH